MRPRLSVWLAGFTFITAATILSSAAAPSFDCRTAKHSNEKLICQSTELSSLDDQMVAIFNSVMSMLNRTDSAELKQSQRRWLRERLNCDDDFLCTKRAYENRIQRLNTVAAKVSNRRTANASDECIVSDPNPPLNVRTTPNGTTIASLPNGTSVIPLDYSENNSWVFVGKSEDGSAIGWVYRNYLDCSGSARRAAPATSSVYYYCSIDKQFPDTNRDKDPVVSTVVIISYGKTFNFLGMEVRHELRSGIVKIRHEQYEQYTVSADESEDVSTYKWSGVYSANHSLSMKGELRTVADLSNGNHYSEELRAHGKLDWIGVWSCNRQGN